MSRPALDGIFLDMYGTLAAGDRAVVHDACERVGATNKLDLCAADLAIAWGERYFAAIEVANGPAFETLAALEARTLRETLAARGVIADPEPFIAVMQAYLRRPPLQSDALEFLNRVQVPVAIVSNADREDLRAALAAHDIQVAHVVSSEDARHYKPHPQIFRHALAATGWDPQRVIHIGDSLHSDVGGAQAAGLRSIWINRAHRIHDIGTAEPDFEFSDLRGALKVLGDTVRQGYRGEAGS